jgi:hypothetical protein
MAFCSNCGGFMADGDKFCGSCGAVVEAQTNTNSAPQQPVQPIFQQNAQPNFQNVQQNYQNPQQPNFQQNFGQGYTQQYVPHAPSPLMVGMNDLGKNLLDFFKKPVDAITNLKLSEVSGFLMGGILTIILTLFTFWHNMAQAAAYTSDYLDYGFGDYIKVFFIILFFVALTIATVWGVVLLLVKFLFKNTEAKVGNLLGMVAFAALPYTASILLATIFGYIDAGVGYVPYFVGVIYTLILLYKGLNSFAAGNETLVFYTFPAIFFALYLVTVLYLLIVGDEIKLVISIGEAIFKGL